MKRERDMREPRRKRERPSCEDGESEMRRQMKMRREIDQKREK